MPCYLCRKEMRDSFIGYYCSKCKRIQDLINLYGDEVYDVLEVCLVRTPDQQSNKTNYITRKKLEEQKAKIYGDKDKQDI